MKQGYEKYIPFVPLKRDRRSWPDKELKKAPVQWIFGMVTKPLLIP